MKRLFSSSPGQPWSQRADLFLIALAILGIGFHFLAEKSRLLQPQAHMVEKMAAATTTVRCFEAIRQHRLGAAGSFDRENDPEESGLIGQEFTLTTTDRGVLEAKLTSVNPNFAALFVHYFLDVGLEAGDDIAIAMTGSFPALNIAVLAAAEELQLKPQVITSVGASMWGANNPDFTWLDMEKLLCDRGLLTTRSLAASLGGSNDRGRGMSPEGRQLLEQAVTRSGIPLIIRPTVDEAIQERIALFDEAAWPRGIKAYVNIGGSSASIGTRLNGTLIPSGVNRVLKPYNWSQRGVLHDYARRRVPVIHMLRIESIAQNHGFPVAPDVVPAVGEGAIFHREVYDLKVVIPLFLIFVVLCFGVLRSRNRAAHAAGALSAPLLLFLLGGAALFVPTAAGAASSRIHPLGEPAEARIRVGGSVSVYHCATLDEPLVFRVQGPTPVRLICRELLDPEKAVSDESYQVRLEIDGVELRTITFTSGESRKARMAGTDQPVGALGKKIVRIPAGDHNLRILPREEETSIAIRLFRGDGKPKEIRWVAFAPESYIRPVRLHTRDSETTYYRFDDEVPAALHLIGPARLKVRTRVDFGHVRGYSQNYTVMTLMDGELFRTHTLKARASHTSIYPDFPRITPGTGRDITIEVPRGHHKVSFYLADTTAEAASLRILIPESAVLNGQ